MVTDDVRGLDTHRRRAHPGRHDGGRIEVADERHRHRVLQRPGAEGARGDLRVALGLRVLEDEVRVVGTAAVFLVGGGIARIDRAHRGAAGIGIPLQHEVGGLHERVGGLAGTAKLQIERLHRIGDGGVITRGRQLDRGGAGPDDVVDETVGQIGARRIGAGVGVDAPLRGLDRVAGAEIDALAGGDRGDVEARADLLPLLHVAEGCRGEIHVGGGITDVAVQLVGRGAHHGAVGERRHERRVGATQVVVRNDAGSPPGRVGVVLGAEIRARAEEDLIAGIQAMGLAELNLVDGDARGGLDVEAVDGQRSRNRSRVSRADVLPVVVVQRGLEVLVGTNRCRRRGQRLRPGRGCQIGRRLGFLGGARARLLVDRIQDRSRPRGKRDITLGRLHRRGAGPGLRRRQFQVTHLFDDDDVALGARGQAAIALHVRIDRKRLRRRTDRAGGRGEFDQITLHARAGVEGRDAVGRIDEHVPERRFDPSDHQRAGAAGLQRVQYPVHHDALARHEFRGVEAGEDVERPLVTLDVHTDVVAGMDGRAHPEDGGGRRHGHGPDVGGDVDAVGNGLHVRRDNVALHEHILDAMHLDRGRQRPVGEDDVDRPIGLQRLGVVVLDALDARHGGAHGLVAQPATAFGHGVGGLREVLEAALEVDVGAGRAGRDVLPQVGVEVVLPGEHQVQGVRHLGGVELVAIVQHTLAGVGADVQHRRDARLDLDRLVGLLFVGDGVRVADGIRRRRRRRIGWPVPAHDLGLEQRRLVGEEDVLLGPAVVVHEPVPVEAEQVE